MSIKRFDGANWIDTNFVRRFDGANWIDTNFVRRFDGANWIDTNKSKEIILYENGDEKLQLTGGWEVIDFWNLYIGGFYEKQSSCLYSEDMNQNYGNKGFRTKFPIPVTGYKINVLCDVYHNIPDRYANWIWMGISHTKADYFQTNSNGAAGPAFYLDGKGSIFAKEYYRECDGKTLINEIITWDVRADGERYIYVSPSSFSLNNYKIKMWIKKIWLSK